MTFISSLKVELCSTVELFETAGESHVENAFEMVSLLFLLKACVHQHGSRKLSGHLQQHNCNGSACRSVCVCLYGRLTLLLEMPGCVHVQTFRQIPFGLQSIENGIMKQCLRGSAEGGPFLFSQ